MEFRLQIVWYPGNATMTTCLFAQSFDFNNNNNDNNTLFLYSAFKAAAQGILHFTSFHYN